MFYKNCQVSVSSVKHRVGIAAKYSYFHLAINGCVWCGGRSCRLRRTGNGVLLRQWPIKLMLLVQTWEIDSEQKSYVKENALKWFQFKSVKTEFLCRLEDNCDRINTTIGKPTRSRAWKQVGGDLVIIVLSYYELTNKTK